MSVLKLVHSVPLPYKGLMISVGFVFQRTIFTLPVFSATMNIRKILTFNFPTSDKRYVIFGSGSGVIWNFFIGFSLSIFSFSPLANCVSA